MSTERFFIADPYNDEHIRLITDFEETNGITTVTSTLLKNIRQTRTEEKYKEEVKQSNEIHQSLFLQNEENITDTCHVQAEKDMKSCRIFFAPINMRSRRLVPLATDYAFEVLGMEDVFVTVDGSTDHELIENLELNGFENLGENDGNIMYLKEKQFDKEQERGNALAA
ncbi:MAG: hypothetical protein IJA30_00490 [Bacilli bacterium]|nr:hypothetical protein [Bacilli bacterium]